MIYELEKTEYHLCQKIINPKGHGEVQAIISGNNPGRVFVDNRIKPQAGFIWLGNLDGFVFIGDHSHSSFNHEVKLFFAETIIPQALKLGLKWIECFGNTIEWNQSIERIFSDRELEVSTQHVYRLPKEGRAFGKYDLNGSADADGDDYTLCKITREIYSTSSFLQSKFDDFWVDVDDFFLNGFGYCIQFQGDVISVCFSSFITEQVHGIDIETKKEYRGKKLGKRVAQAFLEECIARKIEPYWDCMEANVTSVAVAENIGLVKDFSYRLYEFSIKR